MTKTIEEVAKKAIIDNDFFMADPKHPDFVDRGLEQMRACKWVINHIFSLPLASRLTAEEKERVRKMYKGELEFAQFYQRKANSCINQQCRMDYEASRDIAKSRANMLESIFGADFFKEGE